MNEKKKNPLMIVLVIGLILVIIGLVIYICYDKGLITKHETETEEKENKTDIIEEAILTNPYIIQDLNEKLYFINASQLNYEYATLDYNANSISSYNFRDKKGASQADIFNNFNDDVKLQITLDSLRALRQFKYTTPEVAKNSVVADIYNRYDGTLRIQNISIDKVKAQYKKYFGTDIKAYKSFNTCLSEYYYDSNLQMYFWPNPQCGGISAGSVKIYKNKYTTKANEAYVYVNYGLLTAHPETGMSDLYKDINMEEIYKANISDQERGSIEINETNYQDFSEYKYTFKKDENGNYYFVKLERTK